MEFRCRRKRPYNQCCCYSSRISCLFFVRMIMCHGHPPKGSTPVCCRSSDVRWQFPRCSCTLVLSPVQQKINLRGTSPLVSKLGINTQLPVSQERYYKILFGVERVCSLEKNESTSTSANEKTMTAWEIQKELSLHQTANIVLLRGSTHRMCSPVPP
jgi:hypothetical protein